MTTLNNFDCKALQYNFKKRERMQCRPPRRIKRYLTEPDEFSSDNRYKYSNMTLQQLKLQVNAIDTLNDINVPAIPINQKNNQKNPNSFGPFHPKFHLRRNPLKKLPDLNSQSLSNNGCDFLKPIKSPQMFKRSNPLFVVNSLFDILKEDLNQDQNSREKPIKTIQQKKSNFCNQFTEFNGKSMKVQRGPRIVESQLNRLTQQSKFSRRKIHSQQKSRQKGQDVELLTFYKPKKNPTLE